MRLSSSVDMKPEPSASNFLKTGNKAAINLTSSTTTMSKKLHQKGPKVTLRRLGRVLSAQQNAYKLTEFKILASGRRPDPPDFSAAQRPVDRF